MILKLRLFFLYGFGERNTFSAREELIKRIDEGYEADREHINWNTAAQWYKSLLDLACYYVPMSTQGARIGQSRNVRTIRNGGIHPIKPLDYVELTGDRKVTIKVGETAYTHNIGIEGYNSERAKYYGFSASNGHWVVSDRNGNELTDAPIKLTDDNSAYKAIKNGTCYLKYVIDENSYSSLESEAGTFTKNSDLVSTAMFEVEVVPNEANNGIFRITGDYIGFVGAEAESVEGEDKLTVKVYDQRDVEIADFPYYWEAHEATGISITRDGIVKFSKPGRFNIRVVDADEDTRFVISGSYVGGVINDPEFIEGKGKLSAKTYSANG